MTDTHDELTELEKEQAKQIKLLKQQLLISQTTIDHYSSYINWLIDYSLGWAEDATFTFPDGFKWPKQ
jgi:hypothetical protein